MVSFEKELWKFSELYETHSVEKTNELLAEGWVLIEAHAREGKRTFLLGREKIHAQHSQKLDLDKEIEKALQKHSKYKNIVVMPQEPQVGEEVPGELRVDGSLLKKLVTGPVFLGIGLWSFFQIVPKKYSILGISPDLVQNILLFVSIILILVGIINVFYHISKK